MARLTRLGTQKELFGETDNLGRLVNAGPLEGRFINDILQQYEDPAFASIRQLMNQSQRDWIETALQITRSKSYYLERNGIDINRILFTDGGRYFGRKQKGRVLVGKRNVDGELEEIALIEPGKKTVPEKPGALKDRAYGSQDKDGKLACKQFQEPAENTRKRKEVSKGRVFKDP